MVDPQRVKQKIPALLVAGASSTDAKGNRDYKRTSYRFTQYTHKHKAEFDNSFNIILAELQKIERAVNSA